MTRRELTTGVTQQTAVVVAVAALAAAWVGGHAGVVGVLSGGALGLIGFWLLAARVRAVATDPAPAAPWALLASLRFAAVAGVAALLFVGGWAHPVAWLVGYSALPLALVLQGLRAAREERSA
jgi:ATP synthase I chain